MPASFYRKPLTTGKVSDSVRVKGGDKAMDGFSSWDYGKSTGTKKHSAHSSDWDDEDSISYTYTKAKPVSYGYVGGSYRSPSTWWKSKMNYGFSFTMSTSTPRSRLMKALHQLARTVNIVENSVGCTDRSLSIAWGNGDINSPHTDTVYLDAKVLLSAEDDKKDDERIDALTGKALILSSMKRTMSPEAWTDFNNDLEPEVARPIWKAQELIKAKNSVTQDWSGFAPYFDVYEQNQIVSKHEEMLAYVSENKLNAEVFANIVAWNMLAPNHAIEVPEEHRELLETVITLGKHKVNSEKQYLHAQSLAILIKEAFEQEEEEQQQDQQEGNGDEQQEGQSIEQDSSPEGNEASNMAPDFIDQQAFGHPIYEPDAIRIDEKPLSLKDDSLKEGNPFNHTEYANDEDHRLSSISSIGCVRIQTASSDIANEYKKKVFELKSKIENIKSVLSFRKNDTKGWVHAREEGELDEGSLHKLNNAQSNIWSQRTASAKPDVAICILVDESGSMDRYYRYEKVRDVTIVLTEALKGLVGVHTMVLGHTGKTPISNLTLYGGEGYKTSTVREGYDLSIRELYTKNHDNSYALMAISPICENLDGYAIEFAAKRLRQDYPAARQHIIIHLSDGEPCPTSVAQCRLAVDKVVKTMGVQVFSVGVDDAYSQEKGEQLYGKGRNVVIKDVMSSLNILKPFLKKVLSKM